MEQNVKPYKVTYFNRTGRFLCENVIRTTLEDIVKTSNCKVQQGLGAFSYTIEDMSMKHSEEYIAKCKKFFLDEYLWIVGHHYDFEMCVNGRETRIAIYDNGRPIGSGTATRNPDDEDCPIIGQALAMYRASGFQKDMFAEVLKLPER